MTGAVHKDSNPYPRPHFDNHLPLRDDTAGENRDLLDGIGSATDSLARGLKDGVSGLYKNPMRGAERDGFAGFAKGVGTGVLGLVVKPVVGVADAATDVLQGLRRFYFSERFGVDLFFPFVGVIFVIWCLFSHFLLLHSIRFS